MNPQEQQSHRRKTDQLQEAIDKLEGLVAGSLDAVSVRFSEQQSMVGQKLSDQEILTRRLVTEEATSRFTLAKEQRAYVDSEIEKLRRAFLAFRDTSWWQRWAWVVFGRMP